MSDKKCGCGPGDMCTRCTPIGEFTDAFMAALAAQIRDDGKAGDGDG